MLTSSIC